MKWFDKNEIKGKESLTPEQIDYLIQPSITILGPFNFIFRKQFDFFLIWFFLVGVGEFYLSDSDETSSLSVLYFVINGFLQGWVAYFFIKNGRRLAWNRNKWINFEAFQKSEAKWLIATIISFFMVFLSLFRRIPKEMNEDAFAYAIIIPLYLGIVIILPFIQAWRKKKKQAADS